MPTLGDIHATMQEAVSGALAAVFTGGGATVTIGGAATAGNVCHLTFTSSLITGSPVTVSYTVQAGDTPTSIAAGLAAAIRANASLAKENVGIYGTTSGPVLSIAAQTNLNVVYGQSVTGTSPTETISIEDGLTPMVAVGWPPITTLQRSVSQVGQGVVSVYDTKLVRNSTRWAPVNLGDTLVEATLTTELSALVLNPAGTATITLGGSVTPGDAVSCVVVDKGTIPESAWAEVAIGIAGDTPSTMATKLANQINADETLSLWVSAAAVGPVVTLTSILTKGIINLQSYTGNGGTREMELMRKNRQLKIVLWAQTEENRQAIGDPIEALLANLNINFGPTFEDGTIGRLVPGADYYIEDDTLQDAYRRDFLFTLDYPITVTDALYSVLAPVQQFTLN